MENIRARTLHGGRGVGRHGEGFTVSELNHHRTSVRIVRSQGRMKLAERTKMICFTVFPFVVVRRHSATGSFTAFNGTGYHVMTLGPRWRWRSDQAVLWSIKGGHGGRRAMMIVQIMMEEVI